MAADQQGNVVPGTRDTTWRDLLARYMVRVWYEAGSLHLPGPNEGFTQAESAALEGIKTEVSRR